MSEVHQRIQKLLRENICNKANARIRRTVDHGPCTILGADTGKDPILSVWISFNSRFL